MQDLPTYEEAIAVALEAVNQTCQIETVQLGESAKRLLAEDIVCDRNQPPFNRSQMDGYAVVASEISKGCVLEVIGDVAAGSFFEGTPKTSECVAIATGAPVPKGFDAVVPHEQTDCGEKQVTFICDDVTAGACIHPYGVDAKQGDVLVSQCTILLPQHLGIAASCGYETLQVATEPKVHVMTTGDELVGVDLTPLDHQIRNSNGPMLKAMFESMGCAVTTSHITDDAAQTGKALDDAFNSDAHLVVTVGGISAGKRDFLPTAFEHAGVIKVVKGARIKPGKPIYVGKHEGTIILGLPGNPVSAFVCSVLFGLPIVREMQGMPAKLPWQRMTLAHDQQPSPRRSMFRPCICEDGSVTIP